MWTAFWLFVSVLLGALSVPETFPRLVREGLLLFAAVAFLIFVSKAADVMIGKLRQHPTFHTFLERPHLIKLAGVVLAAVVMVLIAPTVHTWYEPPSLRAHIKFLKGETFFVGGQQALAHFWFENRGPLTALNVEHVERLQFVNSPLTASGVDKPLSVVQETRLFAQLEEDFKRIQQMGSQVPSGQSMRISAFGPMLAVTDFVVKQDPVNHLVVTRNGQMLMVAGIVRYIDKTGRGRKIEFCHYLQNRVDSFNCAGHNDEP